MIDIAVPIIWDDDPEAPCWQPDMPDGFKYVYDCGLPGDRDPESKARYLVSFAIITVADDYDTSAVTDRMAEVSRGELLAVALDRQRTTSGNMTHSEEVAMEAELDQVDDIPTDTNGKRLFAKLLYNQRLRGMSGATMDRLAEKYDCANVSLDPA